VQNSSIGLENGLISIIIPAYKESSIDHLDLYHLLESIPGSCLGLPFEIIIVSNSQAPEMIDLVSQHARVTRYCVNSTNVGVVRAWNMGCHLAEGDIFCFINEDVILGGGTLGVLARTLTEKKDIGVIGVEGANFDILSEGIIRQHRRIRSGPPQYCDAVSGFLFMVPAAILRQVGGFEDSLTPCFFEEIDLSLKIRNLGLRSYVVPNLPFTHPWGVSTSSKDAQLNYMGHTESIGAISKRNGKTIAAKWSRQLPIYSNANEANNSCDYYSDSYFLTSDYCDKMTKSRCIQGKCEPPLAAILSDMIETVVCTSSAPRLRVLDLGCAYGFTVQELCRRGHDAYGVDFSSDCIEKSPIKERLQLADIRDAVLTGEYDVLVAANLFEHICDSDLETIVTRLANVSSLLFTIIKKSTHDPSHINLKANWRWIQLLKKLGFTFDSSITSRARRV
jgi:GT2 family glycosyltransferase